MQPRICFLIGIFCAAMSVALGAFGAHAWEKIIQEHHREATFDTAIKYLMFHSLGLVLLGIWGLGNGKNDSLNFSSKLLLAVTVLFCIGFLCFSGSLITISLTGNTWWGRIAPIGGSGFILGWLLWGIAVFYEKNSS